MKTVEYEVTKRAGRRVAGRVVTPGQILELTEAEAEHALEAGELVRKGEKLASAFADDSDGLKAMRADAERVGRRPRPGPAIVEPAPAAAPIAPAAEEVSADQTQSETEGRRRGQPRRDAAPAADTPSA